MTTEVLQKKTSRYLCGESMPAETRQIQNWLSCTTDNKDKVSSEEKAIIEKEIVAEIQAYVTWTLADPKPEPWWKKVTAFF
jgi:hypothetical protein